MVRHPSQLMVGGLQCSDMTLQVVHEAGPASLPFVSIPCMGFLVHADPGRAPHFGGKKSTHVSGASQFCDRPVLGQMSPGGSAQ